MKKKNHIYGIYKRLFYQYGLLFFFILFLIWGGGLKGQSCTQTATSVSGYDCDNINTSTITISCAPAGVTITSVNVTIGIGGNCTSWYEADLFINGSYYNSYCNGTITLNHLNGLNPNGQTFRLRSWDNDSYCDYVTLTLSVTVNYTNPCVGQITDNTIYANGNASSITVYTGQSFTISSSGGNTANFCYWASSDGGATWGVFAGAYCNQASFAYSLPNPGTYLFHVRNYDPCGYCWDAAHGANCTCNNNDCIVEVNVISPAYQSQWISMNFGSTTWCPGETRTVSVTVRNSGTATWTDSGPDVNIGCKWNADPDYLVRVHAGNLAPGATQTYYFTMTAPMTTGANNLRFDVVVEGSCWFGNNNGSCGPGNIVYVSPGLNISSLIINTVNATATQLVQKIVGTGITFANVIATGFTTSGTGGGNRSFFDCAANPLGISSGIILSTGNVANAYGPNASSATSTNNGGGSDPTLAAIASGTIYDAIGIQFDFVPESNYIEFRYVFASEEYNEYVNDIYNDVFGFFISSLDDGLYNLYNMARIPVTNDVVSINNLNNGYKAAGALGTGPCKNCAYYRDNALTGGSTIYNIEYDGFSTVLTARVQVIPCNRYRMKLVVGDVGDPDLDSSVFIEAGSFKSPSINLIDVTFSNPNAGSNANAVEGCSNAICYVRLDAVTPFTRHIPFTISGTATFNVDYYTIPDITPTYNTIYANHYYITIPAGSIDTYLTIVPVNDAIVEPTETINFTLQHNLCGTPVNSTYSVNILDNTSPFTCSVIPASQTIVSGTNTNLSFSNSYGQPNFSYQWSTGGTGSSITVAPTVNSSYTVTVTDACGATTTCTGTVNVTWPLPVEFTSMETYCIDEQVYIKWTTASEQNNNYFFIERSTDNVNYNLIDIVGGSGTTNQRKDYSYTDKNPLAGISYYRLGQTDYDGTTTYLNTIAFVNNCGETEFSVNIFPNPAKDIVFVKLLLKSNETCNLMLNDIAGRKIKEISSGVHDAGYYEFEIPVNDISDGLYYLTGNIGTHIVNYKLLRQGY